MDRPVRVFAGPRLFQVIVGRSGSESRRNTGLQFTRRCQNLRSFSGVDSGAARRDRVPIAIDGQVRSSREVLPQRQVGVFVSGMLSGTMRIPEVDLLIRGYRERLVRQWRFQANGNSRMRIYFLPRNFFSRSGPNSSIKWSIILKGIPVATRLNVGSMPRSAAG